MDRQKNRAEGLYQKRDNLGWGKEIGYKKKN